MFRSLLLFLALSLGARPPEAFLASGVFALCGPILSLENLITAAIGIAYTPWALWALHRMCLGPSSRNVAAFAVSLGFQAQAILPEVLVLDLLGGLVILVHARPRSVLGVLLAVGFGAGLGLAFGSIGLFAGTRAKSAESVQGIFPLLFVFLFLSSMSLPRDLIQTEWFQTVATYNPVSYMIEGIRSLLITGWDGEALALGFGCALAILAAGLTAASLSLRSRLERT